MKSPELRERLGERVSAAILIVRMRDHVQVKVDARESLSVVRVRLDGAALAETAGVTFESRLLASESLQNGRWRYVGELEVGERAQMIQVIVQTVAGRVASVTVPLGDRQ